MPYPIHDQIQSINDQKNSPLKVIISIATRSNYCSVFFYSDTDLDIHEFSTSIIFSVSSLLNDRTNDLLAKTTFSDFDFIH